MTGSIGMKMWLNLIEFYLPNEQFYKTIYLKGSGGGLPCYVKYCKVKIVIHM